MDSRFRGNDDFPFWSLQEDGAGPLAGTKSQAFHRAVAAARYNVAAMRGAWADTDTQ
jgi:hypothetical protein